VNKGIGLFAGLAASFAMGWAGPSVAAVAVPSPCGTLAESEVNPETGHFFEVYAATEITWVAAKACADDKIDLSGVRGHLATITSSSEDVWVDGLRNRSGLGQVWVGGYQVSGSTEPGGGWRWENNEGPFAGINNDPDLPGYTNWAADEPNNNGGSENHLTLGRYGLGGGWNDEGSATGLIKGFVVEYDIPRTAECTVGVDCTTINGQTLEFPPGSFEEGETITFTAFEFTDPRIGLDGKCSDRRQLTLFDDAAFGPAAQLRIPPYLCGSPKFVVVKVNSDELSILKGAVLVENETDTVLPDNLYKCSAPILDNPNADPDPQYQDVVVWQSTDPTKMLENTFGTGLYQGAATEATNGCGSTVAKVRGASYFVVGMHIDFDLATVYPLNAAQNYQQFRALTRYKLTLLRQSIRDARSEGSLRPVVSTAMEALIALAIYRLDQNNPAGALNQVGQFLRLVNAANYTQITNRNFNGDHLMRGENIAFTLRVKVIPFK